MARVVFMNNEFTDNEVHDMKHIPRIGDRIPIPIFNKKYLKVKSVDLLPEEVMMDHNGEYIDAIITLY